MTDRKYHLQKYKEFLLKPSKKQEICDCMCHDKGVIVMHCAPCCHRCPNCNERIVSHLYMKHVEKCKK